MISYTGRIRCSIAILLWTTFLATAALSPNIASACDVCTDDSAPNTLRDGAEAGVWAMLGIIAFVLVSIAGFGGFFYFRARAIARSAPR